MSKQITINTQNINKQGQGQIRTNQWGKNMFLGKQTLAKPQSLTAY